MTVADPSPAYKAMEERRHLPRTLMGGTHAMQAAGQVYLPQEQAESDKAYRVRLNRTVLTNWYRRTVNNVRGKVFSKPVILQDDVPAQLAEWMEDADLMGNHINVFAQNVFADGVEDAGISFVLVDMPRSDAITKADEQRANIRPYFVHVKARNLIGWKSEVINGRETLTQVRIKETRTQAVDEFHDAEVERIRVLERGRFRVFEINDEKEWVVVEEGETTIQEIPLAVFYADRKGFMLANPPLEDLAYLNLTHWQSGSDQRNILHVARVPILFAKGIGEEDQLTVGANSFTRATSEHADMKYVEHSGKAIDAGRQDMVDLEDAMRMFGLELQMPRTGNTTATARAMDGADANSILQMWAIAMGDCLEQALMYAAMWMNLEQGGSAKVNTDFGISLRDATDVDALLKARQAREISRETFWAELRRRGVLIDDFDAEAEQEMLDEEGPALGEIGMDQPDQLDSKVAALLS